MKENIKAPRHWPFCGEFTETGEFPAQKASNAEMFPFDDVIMLSKIGYMWHSPCYLRDACKFKLKFDYGSALILKTTSTRRFV